MPIKAFREELNAELDAFDRDLRKLFDRMDEIESEAHDCQPWTTATGNFIRSLRIARDHIGSSWRSIGYAKANVNNN